MSRPSAATEAALRRMIEADVAKGHLATTEDWEAWQRAAAAYWLLLHPELARFRRGDPARTPGVEEMRDRAAQIRTAMDGIPMTWRTAPPSRERAEHLARVGWYHELMAGLYEPVSSAIERCATDRGAIETLVRFLEADVYCDRSGYMKADVIRALIRADLDDRTVRRLRGVVIDIVDGPDRREFRAYVRLARRVDADELRAPLRTRLASPSTVAARHARWVLEGLGERSP